MELVRFTPIADRRWGGKMQRTARGGCAVRGARQNAGVNARKWGTLDEKTGNFERKVPDVRLFVPKGGGEKQERTFKIEVQQIIRFFIGSNQ